MTIASYILDKIPSFVVDALLIGGIYITAKWTLNALSSVYKTLKIYGIPHCTSRDFVKEYGEWAVVTGASRGIGRSYAHELAKRGLKLVLIARNKALLDGVAVDIREKYNVEVLVVTADLSEKDSFEILRETFEDKDIGILVNNAGLIETPKYFTQMPDKKIEQMIMVNIYSLTTLTKMVLPQMITKRKGAVVNISSIGSLMPGPLNAMYSASKVYVNFLSRALQAEYAHKNITIQCLTPGGVTTDMLDQVTTLKSNMVSPEDYASSAIRTLGVSSYTCGHWMSSLQSKPSDFLTLSMSKKILSKYSPEPIKEL